MTCLNGEYQRLPFENFREVWASTEALTSCEAEDVVGDFYTEDQTAALTMVASDDPIRMIGVLSSICASLHFSQYGALPTYTASQVAEISAALRLCPDQPAAEALAAKLNLSQQIEDQRASGTRFTGGIHLVGDIQPGTYVTEGEINDCYWERLDATGQIIDNNFLPSALRVEVQVEPSDYSFSSTGCGEWVLQ